MSIIHYYEHSRIEHPDIIQTVTASSELQNYFAPDFGGVKSKQHCGLLHVNGQTHYILPKIAKDEHQNLHTFIYMLAYAHDFDLSNTDIGGSDNASLQMLEVLIALFAKELLNQLQLGLYREYVTFEENLQTLRGKYLIDENLRYNLTAHRIYCAFDEFSMDNQLNRFFLFAVKTLLGFTCKPKKLRLIEAIYDEVGYIRHDVERLTPPRFDRLSLRYKKSYDMAALLLKRLLPLFDRGERSFAFLFDMNELFERFVGKMIMQIKPETQLQKERNFGNLKLKPDIVLPELIIDTKYKLINGREDISAADKYQMFTYGKNFQISQTMLLYPKYLLHVKDDLMLGKEEGVALMLRSVDLDFDGGYEGFIDNMKEEIKRAIS